MERTRRIVALVLVLVLSLGVLAGLAASDEGQSRGQNAATDQPYPGNTLITVQAYGWFGNHNGEAFIVTPEGERVWEYQPENAAVFDGEYLDNGNVMLSYGQRVPDPECPPEMREAPKDHCIQNHVVEITPETNEVVWQHTWYDRFMSSHEVHDADRLPNGQTVIIDMGKNRVFTVDQSGTITWEWSAIENLGKGSAFWEQHVEGTAREDHTYTGPDQDWTHMNDVDRLENGNFLLSIRNFDVLVEVDPETDNLVRVVGEPGNQSIMHEQHNPHYLGESDHVLVADSENDRIVEYDTETKAETWRYEGPGQDDRLAWPRDADRLPNGNTLIADSRNFRVLEVNETGSVVWMHDMRDQRAIAYDADRLGPDRRLEEEPRPGPPGDQLQGSTYGPLSDALSTVNSWLAFVLPPWVGLVGFVAILVALGSLLGLAWEGYRWE
jgi:outer membrane protein assembly factor BamB